MNCKLWALIGFGIFAGANGTAIAQQRLTASQTGNGVLGGSDPRDSAGSFYDDFQFTLDAGQRVRVEASRPAGSSLDPVIEIYAPGQSQYIARDDDGGDFPNARVEFVAPRAGTYVFRVLSFGSSTGPYDLRIAPIVATAQAGNLATVNEGRFNNSVATLANGAHYRDYRVQLTAGQDIALRMNSADFDSIIRIYVAGSESGQPLDTNDDFGGSLNSGLLFRAPRSGSYTVRATELSHRDGAYVLRATILP